MRSLLVIIVLCVVAGCGRGQSKGERLNEVDPGDPTPPVLTIDDAKSIRLNLTYSPDGKRLVTGSNYIPSAIRVWDAATGQQLLEIDTKGHAVMGLEFTPDGSKLVCVLQRGNKELNVATAPVIVFDSESGEMLRRFETGFQETAGLAMSRDGRLIACGGPPKSIDAGGTPEHPKQNTMEAPIKVLDFETGELLSELAMENTSSGISYLEFSPAGNQLASGSGGNKSVHRWSLPDGELSKLPSCGGPYVSCLAYSPDGKQIAFGCGQTVKVCSVETGEELLTLGESRKVLGYLMGNLNHVAFSPDGKHLAAASGFGVHVWDLATGTCVRTLKDPNANDNSRHRFYPVGESPFSSQEVVYSPDGRHIVCKFYKILMWETK